MPADSGANPLRLTPVIMGVESGGGDGLIVGSEEDEQLEESDDEVSHEVVAVLGDDVTVGGSSS